jgi:hypothetical protein
MNDGFKLAIQVKAELQEMEKAVEDLRDEVERLKRQRRPRDAAFPSSYMYRSTGGH